MVAASMIAAVPVCSARQHLRVSLAPALHTERDAYTSCDGVPIRARRICASVTTASLYRTRRGDHHSPSPRTPALFLCASCVRVSLGTSRNRAHACRKVRHAWHGESEVRVRSSASLVGFARNDVRFSFGHSFD